MFRARGSYYNSPLALIFVLGFAVIGVVVMFVASAATSTASIEAESGAMAGGAQSTSVAGASGGSAVRFAATATPVGSLTAQDLTRVARLKMFFGRQSVGGNILQGVPEVYASYGVTSIPVIPVASMGGATGGYLAEASVGQNFQPLLKNSDFDSRVRGGIGSQVNVAFFKYCFVDITSGTDTTALFNQYKSLMDVLARDYPNVTFIHVTNPLTTSDVADNVVRERYNQLIRQEYGSTGRLFDLAKIESTTPGGSRVSGVSNGSTYYSLYGGYSTDGGHLNAAGRQAAAKELLTVIANATR